MSLKDDINKINEREEQELLQLEKDFAKFELQQDQDRQKFLEKQELDLVNKAQELQKRDAEIRAKAQQAIDKVIADADKLLEEQETKNETSARIEI